MEEQYQEQLRQKIITAISETEVAILNLQEKTRPVSPDNAIGRLSRMDAIGNKNVNELSLHSTREKLTKLKYALASFDNPDFGICKTCAKEIPMARIMIMPESYLCVQCAEDLE